MGHQGKCKNNRPTSAKGRQIWGTKSSIKRIGLAKKIAGLFF
jgi:hypothetical protein